MPSLKTSLAQFSCSFAKDHDKKRRVKKRQTGIRIKMITFFGLQFLFEESTFLKYYQYFLPLLLFLLTKHVWQRFSEVKNRKQVIDISANIQTDSASDKLDDELYKPHLPERDHVPYHGVSEWLDKSGERFYKLANDRRSIRKFAKNKPVDIGVIEKCILAAGELISTFD